jgi:hypothetical protein
MYTDIAMFLSEHISQFQKEEYQAIIELHYKQKHLLNIFQNYQNNILDKIQTNIYQYYLDAILEKDDNTQEICLYKIKIKKIESKIIYNFQKKQRLALIKIQNAEYQAFNMISMAIINAINIVVFNQYYTNEKPLDIFDIWNQANIMNIVIDAKNQARINVLNVWNKVQNNIQNITSKHLQNYINKSKYINKSVKNLGKDKNFNLFEIQNYDTFIEVSYNIYLNIIKNAMSIFLIEIKDAKKQTMYKVNKAREQAMNNIQYKMEAIFCL